MRHDDYVCRHPRTLQEAFGPSAEWHVDRRSWSAKIIPYAITIAIALLVGVVSWSLG